MGKARKKYVCQLTNKVINIGDEYIRINIRNLGVYHFHISCDEHDIKDFMYSENYYSKEKDLDPHAIHPTNFSSFDEEIMYDMPVGYDSEEY